MLLGWTVLYTIFVAVANPYAKRYHYYRGLATQSAAVVIFVLYCLLTKISDEMYLASFRMIAIAVLAVLLLNLLSNLTFIAIAIRKQVSAENKVRRELKEQPKKEIEQLEMNLIRNMKDRLERTYRGNASLNETMWRRASDD